MPAMKNGKMTMNETDMTPSVRAYTVADVMRARPCAEYPEERVRSLWAGKEGLAASDIAALAIPYPHRCWALIELCLDDRTRRLLACDCAEDALGRVPELDRRFAAVVEVARRYAAGEMSVEALLAAGIVIRDIILCVEGTLSDAAWNAAWAVRHTTRASAKYAVKGAVWDGALSVSALDTWDRYLSWAVCYADRTRP